MRTAFATLGLALRRLRRRRLQTGLLVLALAGAGGIIGASSVVAALAHEENVRLRLSELPAAERSLQVRYRTQPGSGDPLASTTSRALARFTDVTGPSRRVRIWDPIAPADERGIRLVEAGQPTEAVSVASGRLPHECHLRTCEALALDPSFRLGQEVSLGRTERGAVRALIVGRGSLTPEALPQPDLLGERALLLSSTSDEPIATLLGDSASLVVTTAALDPPAVHSYGLNSLAERLRQETVRLGRADPSVSASAPVALLEQFARSGRVARERLLLVAGQGAALILAFAAFAAMARREDVRLLREQMETLSASRRQVGAVRAIDVAVPTAIGATLALGGLFAATGALMETRDLPSAFLGQALPLETLLAVLALTAIAAAILFVAASPRPDRRSRLGLGMLEIAALTALGVIVWQSSTTSGLDPSTIAAGRMGAPILLLTPTLAVFAGGVLLLRLLPPAFRLGERFARRAPFGVRLAFLSAARRPAQAAAATTFLAVALGSALFALSYRATLERQAHDAASFEAGARWRVVERGEFGSANVTPLTRFDEVTSEVPTAAFRLPGTLRETGRPGQATEVEVLAFPAGRLSQVLGWRGDFSDLSRAEIARRLRPRPIELGGPTLGGRAVALKVWARARTDVPRVAVLHFLLPGQRFERLELGSVRRAWKLLRIEVPRSLRGGELVGIGFPPAEGSPGPSVFDEGFLELGPLEQKQAGGWTELPSLGDWTATPAPGRAGFLYGTEFNRAPVPEGIQFDLNGTGQPFIRPTLSLPEPLPALVGPPVARAAVDGVVTVNVLGQTLAVRVVGVSSLFPTITKSPSSFAVFDYDTLFAALNADSPGVAEPSEAWFFRPKAPAFLEVLRRPPFRLEAAVSAEQLEERLLEDPLARGTERLLTWSALAAAALGLFGLVLATRSALVSERELFAEYEVLGVPPATLARSVQVRLVLLSVFGLIAALAGAALAVMLVSAFVAVTAAAGRPLPPIEPLISWGLGAALLAGVAIVALLAAVTLASRSLRETTATRLRA